ncbi:protein kinase domain-containing protein [Streptosporangium sp. CA-135522]|uniref:protein kinase domain-containing protein n=1 Tax=Streptosporangium sp. CA-135522 TaxID=3240072 RepID=UPI003D8A82AB
MRQIQPLQPSDPVRLGRFRLTGRLGSGGQGVVFLGTDEAGQRFAVKVPHLPNWADGDLRERFARELETARRTAPAFTARIVEADLEGEQPYIVSEYIEGASLRELVTADGPLHQDAVHRLAMGLASALAAIHQAGIVHRDVKPDNVLMGPDGPRLIDFGIARLPGITMTSSGQMLGTPLYMAPEVFGGERVGPAADVFAWGAVVAFAATGRHAFEGGEIPAIMRRILTEQPDLTAVSETIRPVVAAALAKQPADRPNAVDLLVRLVGGPSAGPPQLNTVEVAAAARRRRTRVALAAGSAVLVLATAGVVVAARQAELGTTGDSGGTMAQGPGSGSVKRDGRSGTGGKTTGDPALPGFEDKPVQDPAEPETGDKSAKNPGAYEKPKPVGKKSKPAEEEGGGSAGSTQEDEPAAGSPPAVSEGGTRAYYDVGAAEHGRQAARLKEAGFRPLSISITDRGYTALWGKVPGDAYVTAHDLTLGEYQTFWEKWVAKGYVETITAAHGAGSAAVFAIVMEKREVGHLAHFGMTSPRFRIRNAEAARKGYIPSWITIYGVPGSLRYSAAWVQNTEGTDWHVTFKQTAQQFQAEFDRQARDHFRPDVTIAPDGKYTAVWKRTQGAWSCYSGLIASRHVARLKQLRREGYRLTRLTAAQVGAKVRYSLLAAKE